MGIFFCPIQLIIIMNNFTKKIERLTAKIYSDLICLLDNGFYPQNSEMIMVRVQYVKGKFVVSFLDNDCQYLEDRDSVYAYLPREHDDCELMDIAYTLAENALMNKL